MIQVGSVLAVDWSGAKNPAGKIWIGKAKQGLLTRLEPVQSRKEAVNEVILHLSSEEKGIAGLDFGFSLPAWFLRENSLSSAFELWDLVEQEGERWLQECCWPFWGRTGKKKNDLRKHFRRTEELCNQTQGIKPKSMFQIGGAGTVGTGSIRGMPFLSKIREQGFAIWPFDICVPPLVAEIYPRVLTGPVLKSSKQSRAKYLGALWPDLPSKLATQAIYSEDAFDTAVSALMMDRHFSIKSLPRIDRLSRLEGEIWVPFA
mgnify:CR=1 FL=1